MAKPRTSQALTRQPKKAAPQAAPKVVLPEGYRQMNRTSLTTLARRLGLKLETKFTSRAEGRKALEALVG
jgi:hypothetical protein